LAPPPQKTSRSGGDRVRSSSRLSPLVVGFDTRAVKALITATRAIRNAVSTLATSTPSLQSGGGSSAAFSGPLNLPWWNDSWSLSVSKLVRRGCQMIKVVVVIAVLASSISAYAQGSAGTGSTSTAIGAPTGPAGRESVEVVGRSSPRQQLILSPGPAT
jgi:hypothetical protein